MKIPSMKQSSTRAQTFLKYPGVIIIQVLVTWGLFYTGNARNMQCYYCGHMFTEWKEKDSAINRHLKESPSCGHFQRMKNGERVSCDHLNNITSSEVTGIKNLSSQLIKKSTNRQHLHCRQETPASRSDEGGSTIHNPEQTNSVLEDSHDISALRHQFETGQRYWSDANRQSDLMTIEERKGTFTDWTKHDAISPDELALAGFKYVGSGDRVQCVYCRQVVENWQNGDSAFEKHRNFSHFCPLLDSLKGGLVERSGFASLKRIFPPRQPAVSSGTLQEIGIVPINENALHGMETFDLRVVTATAKFPQYSKYENRKVTFNSCKWKQLALPQSGEDFAKAGLFHRGYKDRVSCFFCGNSIEKWSIHDVPMYKHHVMYPDCEYVQQQRNETSLPLHDQLDESSLGAVGGDAAGNLPNTFMKREDTPEGKVLQEMGYSEYTINRAYRSLEKSGKSGITTDDLLDEIFKQENIHAHDSDDEPERQVKKTCSDITSAKRATESKENERLKKMFYCWKCKEKISNVLFLPCSHMIYCQDCYQGNASDPICAKCNSHVRGIVKTYTS